MPDAAERTWQVYLATRAEPAYGLWALVALNALVFVIFAFSFGRPRTTLEWRSFGGFTAFVVALFAEMYGFPLTLYALSGWLQSRYPGLDLLTHDAGHLWQTIFGLQGPVHAGALHVASNALIVVGFVLIVLAWRVLHAAQRADRIAAHGPYAAVRHPQYLGFMLILAGLLLQWPTILTLAMFPVLVWMYARLARREEQEMQARFGETYARVIAGKPRFIPWLRVPDFTAQKKRLANSEATMLKRVRNGYQSPGSPMAMPPKGGNSTLTDDDLTAVIKYMRRTFGR